MPKKMEKDRNNLLQNMALFIIFAALFWLTLFASTSTLTASTSLPPQQDFATITPTQQQLQVPQQNQQLVPPPPPPSQFPQIPWNELEEADGFVAKGKIDSIIYTVYGNWIATGDWTMNVSDGDLISFDTAMAWHNGTTGHSHEFLNTEATDVDINAEDQTISTDGCTMDVGTNQAVSWEDVPCQIVIEAGRIITVSVDDELTNRHFAGQSVHGNVTSLTVCSATPGAAMQIFSAC